MTVLSFGPLAYDLGQRRVPASWSAFVSAPRRDARPVVIRAARGRHPDPHGPAPDFAETRFWGWRRHDHDEVELIEHAPGWHAPEIQGPAAIVSHLAVLDAPSVGAIVVHAAAVHVGRGVVLIIAPPGTGKSTLAQQAGPAAFAYNSVLVRPETPPLVWPLPFAGGSGDPPITDTVARQLIGIACLERAAEPYVEPLAGGRATIAIVKAVVRPLGHDPRARERASLAAALAAMAPALRLGSPADARYLLHLNSQCGNREQ